MARVSPCSPVAFVQEASSVRPLVLIYNSMFQPHFKFVCLFFTIDNEAPIITTPSDVLSINVETNMASVVVNWSPAPSAEDTVEGVITAIACQNQLGAVVASGDRYPVGTTTVNCTASDSVPNTATKQFTITVVGKWCVSLC